ncbi:DinB family protein [Terriglobus tenax]|uniref:DinB family protein n=1 Tax=Terriglobus tenax TaxID=1111115 RepID=UPI0021DFEAB9|nr:DinB family protein [Terriglobus tenax]
MSNEALLVATAIAHWKLIISRIEISITRLSDEQLLQQIAPGKNRVVYLVGHLAAVHDRLFPLLGIGERLHPELDEPYLNQPDRTVPDLLTPAELREVFKKVNAALAEAFDKLTPDEWLQPHTAVSADDFAKDPLRNRLAVLLSRASHAAFHTGQAILVK